MTLHVNIIQELITSAVRLKDLLDDELGRIPKDERIFADADALVRSIWKEFCSTHKN